MDRLVRVKLLAMCIPDQGWGYGLIVAIYQMYNKEIKTQRLCEQVDSV